MAVSRRRERERAARREAILDAAEPVIMAKGYQGLVMDEVAAAAELSKGTLYLYFENKDALCAAVAERNMRERVVPSFRSAVTLAGSPLSKMRAFIASYVEHFVQQPQIFRFMISWLLSEDPSETQSDDFAAYRARIGEIYALVTSAIVEGQREGTIRDDVGPALLVHHLWTSLVSMMIAQVAERALNERMPEPVQSSALLEFHIEQIMDGLLPRGAPEEFAS